MSVSNIVFVSLVVGLVSYPANVVAQTAAAPEWTVVLKFEIDASRDNLVPFGRISVGPAGLIALAQSQDRRVILYDSLGRRQRAVGSRGQGPGEIQILGASGWLGDSIWLADNRTRAISIYNSAGQYVRQFAAPGRVSSAIGGQPWRLTDGSPLAIASGGRGLLTMFLTQLTDGKASCPCIATALDSVTLRSPPIVVPPSVDEDVQTTQGVRRPPFPWDSFFDASPDGREVVIAYATRTGKLRGVYHITKISVDGDTVFSKDFAFPRTAVPPAELRATLDRAARNSPDLPRAELERRASSHYAPVRRVLQANDGRTWILLFTTSPALLSQERWLILSPAGNPIGYVGLPLGIHLLEAEGSSIWGYRADSNGLQHPVRFSIVAGFK